ncbi:MAG: CapA family protein [Lachnospiraceae bacterium]|nr:CapA family protein [Lachnospiraceae bacterium]
MKKYILTILFAALILSGCGTVSSETKENASEEAVSEETMDASAEAETPAEPEEPEEPEDTVEPFDITLAFAGDINFDDNWSVMAYYHSIGDDLEAVIDPDYIKLMNDADLFWINNEFTYSYRGAPMPDKYYTFRSSPENVEIMKTLGADIVGLANNHCFDYGEESFYDTLETLKNAGIPYVGAGMNIDEAKAPVYLEAQGVKIAYVAASRAEKYRLTPPATEDSPGILRCYDNEIFIESIKEAAENADYVIALPHWGTEDSTVLEEAQLTGAKEYIDAGADAVIGAHTHWIQGMDEYKGKPIAYSLGNFWFNDESLETMLYELHLKGEKVTTPEGEVTVNIESVEPEIIPGMQENCVTTMAEGAEKTRILEYIDSISP